MSLPGPATTERINSLTRAEFVALIGPVFEASPWIAERAWELRPFTNTGELKAKLFATVEAAGPDALLALIRAHPDLVGRLAAAGMLTPESQREQTAAGLLALDAETVSRFEEWNAAYKERFGFPFVICARLNAAPAILEAFEKRLGNSREEEIATAWAEIRKIADLRLADLVREF